ncbi:MAG TPA: response regulator transcription factor, partial [Blastocatellia bacterium]|nr:response regulator transcription factor [Blastocatellia bacterium]
DSQALDYLLKPFDEERFQRALGRARRELRLNRGAAETLKAVLEELRRSKKGIQRLAIKSGGRVVFLKSSDIDWIEAEGNYVTLHVGKEKHMLRATMSSLEPRLDPQQFVRIHRSTIVNLDQVKEMRPWFHGEQVMVLKDGTRLTVGRKYRQRVELSPEGSSTQLS